LQGTEDDREMKTFGHELLSTGIEELVLWHDESLIFGWESLGK
jgi:hypothetical protein